jgi:hypothetical protein
MPVNTLIQVRRGSGEGWSNAPNQLGRGILYNGEIGYETDTGKLKIGDGSLSWDSLCYNSVPLNSDNFTSTSGINIAIGSNCGSATWSIDETWLTNFIATSSGSLNVEGVQDIIGNSGVVGGFGIDKSYNDSTGFTTVSVTGMTLRVEESTGIGVAEVTESNNKVYTVSVTGIDHTLINDWDAALSGNIDTQLIAGTGINFVYDSGNNSLTISTAVLDDSHTHVWDNITDAKVKASLTELGYLSGVVPGTASADRVLVLDSDKDITGIDNLTSNATITAVTFSGDLSGDVTSTGSSSFTSVDINGGSIDGTVIGADSAAIVSGTSVYASVGFVGDLTGDVTGNADSASTVAVTENSSEDAPLFLTFVDENSGDQDVEVDNSLRYNPLTNTISAGGVSATGTVSADHVSSATLTTTGNIEVGGNLTVLGTTTTLNVETVLIEDNIIQVNGSGLANGGFAVQEGTSGNYKQLIWNNSTSRWEFSGSANVYTGGTLTGDTLESTVADGTAPISVTSTTLVDNLNADLLDGQHGSYYRNFSNISGVPTPDVTVTLSGDVSGTDTVSSWDINNNLNIGISTTIQPDSVALGTDTTGNYVAAVAVNGSGLTLGGSAGEGATFTVESNATPANTADTIVSRDSSGNFSAGTITASLAGNASTASKLADARYIELTGDVVGSGLFDGSADIQISTTVNGAGTVTLANEASDTDNYLTFANDATGDQSLFTNVNIRFDASNNKLLGTSSSSTSPTSRLEYFIIDGGSP